jgi:hypothetical protein
MSHCTKPIVAAALACLVAAPVLAAEPLVSMRVVQVGEVEYISGGKSPAEREELRARTDDFRLQINFSAPELKRVDVKLKRHGERGRPLQLTAAGPLLLVNMPSGTYTISASSYGAAPVESQFELQPGESKELELELRK